MVKKTGLGKGLDALFSMPVVEEEKMQSDDSLQSLKLIDIEPNREQPRKFFDEESIGELAESIKMYGVIQPIVVTKKEGYYAIIAGERRWRAAKKAGLTEIPAIIRKTGITRLGRILRYRKNSYCLLIVYPNCSDLRPLL